MTRQAAIDRPIGSWNGNGFTRMGFPTDEVELDHGPRPRVAPAHSTHPQRIECAPI